jgi:hypothetical protein
MTDKEREQVKDHLRRLRGKATLRKVSCFRKVASSNRASGDILLGFEVDVEEGTTLDEARVLSLLVGLEVDLAAHRNALAGGIISSDRMTTATKAIKSNYNALLSQTFKSDPRED